MTTPRRVHLLGARGPMGATLAARLRRGPTIELRGWSGAAGERSYASFLDAWRRAPDRDAVVIFAGGRVGGTAESAFADHVQRTAVVVDAFAATAWPARALVLGSAAELTPSSVYGLAKRVQRELVAATARSAGARCLALRVHSVIPDERPERGLPADLLRQFETGGTVRVRSLGGARDYVTAGQVAAVVVACAASDTAWDVADDAPIDVGTGVGVRVGDWIDAFAAAFGGPREVVATTPDAPDSEIVADPKRMNALLFRAGGSFVEEHGAAAGRPLEAIQRWRARSTT